MAAEKTMVGEKISDALSINGAPSYRAGDTETAILEKVEDDGTIFKKGEGVVDFRTVSWPKAASIFFKVIFSTGVLSIPTAMYQLGAVGGSLSVIGWGIVNTYAAMLLGQFRNNHPQCHSIADMAELLGGPILREVVGALFVITCVLAAGSGILGISIALNVFSTHGACTVWFTLVGTLLVVIVSSFRKLHQIGLLTYLGCISIYAAVFIVVVGVTTKDRPASAPKTGDFDLGYYVIAHPDFVTGIGASLTVFASSGGASAFVPVMSEMRKPTDYNKAVFACMGLTHVTYLVFSLVVYKWCGSWVANPSLGSAGRKVELASYGVGFAGLVISACIWLHVSSKYIFVRILRHSRHLQDNSITHWVTWLGCVMGLGTIGFILCEAVPIFSYLIALIGALGFGPLTIMLPAAFWLLDHWAYRKQSLLRKAVFMIHIAIILLGAFVFVAGTYAVIKEIMAAYADGTIGGVFSCADNAGVTASDLSNN